MKPIKLAPLPPLGSKELESPIKSEPTQALSQQPKTNVKDSLAQQEIEMVKMLNSKNKKKHHTHKHSKDESESSDDVDSDDDSKVTLNKK